MSLKEFDYKQFLLEKGERVGLGVAVTLMVLMLVLSLFLPKHGFFSGSPAVKAKALEDGAQSLQNKLNTLQPGPEDLPPKDPENNLIALDIEALDAKPYEMLVWWDPLQHGSQARRMPVVKNIVEARWGFAHIPVETYIFNDKFTKIMVLVDKGGSGSTPSAGAGAGAGAGANRLAGMYQRGSQGSGMANMQQMMQQRMQGGSGGGMNPMMRGMRGLTMGGSGNVVGGDDKNTYEARQVDLTKLEGGSYKLARQLRPARMAILVGSFPYKAQLEEFRTKLHLPTIQDVLNDSVEEEKDAPPKAAFRFLGVEVERKEVDPSGKDVAGDAGKWAKLALDVPYKLWLLSTGYPYQEDSSKLDPIKPLFEGLVMPRLREFHEQPREQNMSMMLGGPGAFGSQPAQASAAKEGGEAADEKTKYPDVEDKLPKIKETLEKLADVNPKKIAVTPERFRTGSSFNPFSSSGPAEPADNNKQQQPTGKDATATPGDTVPEYCLMRLIDVTVEPGKSYKYRLKIRMANPNYKNPNVASPTYKEKPTIESAEWYEVPQTVTIPTETNYYVVDQKKLTPDEKPAKNTPLAEMWDPIRVHIDPEHQVCFQFQRWLESAQIIPNEPPEPIGDWAVADRVPVARGEYVGRTVKIDLPVWQYTKEAFILPEEEQKRRGSSKQRTGVYVNFGYDNADSQTILVDFEGGTSNYTPPATAEGARPRAVQDTSPIEVLMLSPDGKLLARNSYADAKDEDRQKRREEFNKRVQHVRESKSGGGSGGAGGLDSRTGGTRR